MRVARLHSPSCEAFMFLSPDLLFTRTMLKLRPDPFRNYCAKKLSPSEVEISDTGISVYFAACIDRVHVLTTAISRF